MKNTQGLTILLEDEQLLVVNKPAGLLTVPGRQGGHSLREAVAYTLGITQKLFLVHRLDAGTSGVLLLAKTPEAQRHLAQQFQNRLVQKEYLAIVRGSPEEDSGLIVAPIAPHPRIPAKMIVSEKKGRPSQTKWQIVDRFQGISLVRCRPLTGRQHQIRVHLALIEMPLLVDPLYGNAEAFYLSQLKVGYKPSNRHEERPLLARLSLHADALNFTHPRTNHPVRVEAPLPKDLHATLTQLRKLCGSAGGAALPEPA
ncbi:MAG: RluA family pseudouridine synthase [Phycisphaerales bacterium]|nr:RluA family pseudouridine synthase [Phycisphaerales bacterium]